MRGLLVTCLMVACCNAQSIGHLTVNGTDRQYAIYVPSSTPTGLIVVLHPSGSDSIQKICDWTVGKVSASTGAIVVCPAAAPHKDVKSGSVGPCWKAWAKYGTCEGTEEDSEDVEYLAALIQHLKNNYTIPEGKIIMSGMSNGGSMAFRFNCEKSELIGGLVIQSQAFLDPYVGFYDYVNNRVPTGTPQCNPQYKRPFYTDVGTMDEYYGPGVVEGFRAFPDWQRYSTDVLGCTGTMAKTSQGPHDFPQGNATTCYEYPSCKSITTPGINRYCSVTGMHHDATGLSVILPTAFADFFGGPIPPSPAPAPSPPSPAPSPSPGKGDYLCYQGACYDKPGYGKLDKDSCEKTCSKSFLDGLLV
jgi:predicted esterase